jgi:CheY-like chemotaxis protein
MKNKHWCILVDDEDSNNQLLQSMLEEDGRLIVERVFTSPLRALEELPKVRSSIVFLDVHMTELDGLELAESMQDKLIVFVSAHDHALKALEKNPVTYLQKPLKSERLMKVIDDLVKRADSIERPWFAETSMGLQRIFKKNIIKIVPHSEGSGSHPRNKLVYTIDRDVPYLINNTTLEEILLDLNCSDFVLIRKDAVVNIQMVESRLPGRKISLPRRDGTTEVLTIGDSYYNSFCHVFDRWSVGYKK